MDLKHLDRTLKNNKHNEIMPEILAAGSGSDESFGSEHESSDFHGVMEK